MDQTYPSLTEAELCNVAMAFAKTLSTPLVIAFWGDLGVGKSTFIRKIIQTLLKDDDAIVPSPTFTLIQTYESSKGPLCHADLYRLSHCDEIIEIGLLEMMQNTICFIEWPERLTDYLPPQRIDVRIDTPDEDHRKLSISYRGRS
jgi:tRNA threonylcarbamoyladenosine biosynthesis protein TsaE